MTGKRKVRLQKFLSQAGIASRRAAEKLILAGKVTVNGEVVKKMGILVDPLEDRILFSGDQVQPVSKKVIYLFYKPKNVMVTRHDPEGRPTIYDYLKKVPERVNPVGRLDFDSEGLLLLTNDGEFHYEMTHPSKKIPKVYRVRVSPLHLIQSVQDAPLKLRGAKSDPGLPWWGDKIQRLSRGVDIGDYVTRPCEVKVIEKNQSDLWLEITIHEGKNRQIRRMCQAVGLDVLRLVRIKFGRFSLAGLVPGQVSKLR